MCERDGGLRIFETASGVKSIYYSGRLEGGEGEQDLSIGEQGCSEDCRNALLRDKFDYVEASVAPGNKYASDWQLITPGDSGLFRFTVEKTGHTGCGPFEIMRPIMFSGGNNYAAYNNLEPEYCIATNRIEEITARYEVARKILRIDHSGSDYTMKYIRTVHDRTNGTLMARTAQYFYHLNSRVGPESRNRCPRNTFPIPYRDVLKP